MDNACLLQKISAETVWRKNFLSKGRPFAGMTAREIVTLGRVLILIIQK